MNSYTIAAPAWKLTYRGVNVTADLSRMVTAISYTDRLEEYAGECQVTFEDSDGLWQGPWYPQAGDQMSLAIGYENDAFLECGDFQVDEMESSGPPDRLALRCIAAWITPAMRTRKSIGYENVTLPQLAGSIASQYGFSVSSEASSLNVKFERITQRHESDLEFLKRLAQTHGYYFTVRGPQFTFYAASVLEGLASGLTASRSDVSGFSFINRSFRIYRGAQVSYQSPSDKSLIVQDAAAPQAVAGGDTTRLIMRCENDTQAGLKAAAELYVKNKSQQSAWVVMPGRANLVAGNSVTLTGFGENSGAYLIEEARHRIERRTGYTTEMTMYRPPR